MLKKEYAVEVIDLVQYGPRLKRFAGHFKPVAFDVLGARRRRVSALDLFAEARDAETALFTDLGRLRSK